jgi:hypothetical protein
VFGEGIGWTTFNSSKRNRKKIIIKGFENRERKGSTTSVHM